jgi:nucleoside-diphosphate-sugar epimerase
MQVVAITGGSGFVGLRLAFALLDDASLGVQQVRLLDVRAPASDIIPFAPSQRHRAAAHRIALESEAEAEKAPLRFVRCDLRSKAQVRAALVGVDTVFHLASYGMSGVEQLRTDMIKAVNLGGTRTLLDTCLSSGATVRRLVYVSSYNAVFTRHVLENACEELVPYPPALKDFHDEYSRTKMIAEKMVLAANGAPVGAGEGVLNTCAIRPAAIYGDGEERHFPRILRSVRAGLGFVGIGDRNTKCDWVYVDNLVHGLVLAGKSLAQSQSSAAALTTPTANLKNTSKDGKKGDEAVNGSPPKAASSSAAGRAYAISDGSPMNNFVFLRLICEGLGYHNAFRWFMPFWLAFHLAWMLELVRSLLLVVCCRLLVFQPPLTRAEVCKVGVTHYFSMNNAERDLGYRPVVSVETAVARCVEYYFDEYATKEAKREAKQQQEGQGQGQDNHQPGRGQSKTTAASERRTQARGSKKKN